MAVCTLKKKSLAVIVKDTVLDFDVSEALLAAYKFCVSACFVSEGDDNCVKIGAFSTPEVDEGEHCSELY